MNIGSNPALLGAITMCVGLAMMRLGIRTNQLSLRKPGRRCASCSRLMPRGGACAWCTRDE
jgi:hypothetical protein